MLLYFFAMLLLFIIIKRNKSIIDFKLKRNFIQMQLEVFNIKMTSKILVNLKKFCMAIEAYKFWDVYKRFKNLVKYILLKLSLKL